MGNGECGMGNSKARSDSAFPICSVPWPAGAQGISTLRAADFGRARRWRRVLASWDEGSWVAWATSPQVIAENDSPYLRPSTIARRLVGVLRLRCVPRISTLEQVPTNGLRKCAKSFQGESTPAVQSLWKPERHRVTSTPDVRRTYLPRGLPTGLPRGKAPPARNLAGGVSDDFRGALSRVGLDPPIRTRDRPRSLI